jgi:uncharacterized protein YndB with AHSA1/START domain
MSKPSFVGFQEKVVIPEGFELLEINEKLESALGRDDLFALLALPEKLSQWFYTFTSVDLRPGGKVNFVGDDGATLQAVCTSVVFEKEISYIADVFGNLTVRVSKAGKLNVLEINFKILTDQPEEKRTRILQSIAKLKALVS